MREHDALVNTYQHLEHLPRAVDALHTLRKISSLVKPIMRKRGWRVGTLKEFCPEQTNLLGLNIDRGRSICLRLRHPGDNSQFLPLEQVVDTMLHELSHNVHGAHDAKFQALWNELRDEYMDLKLKGYSGEGFLSEGHRLGGRGVPVTELRRRARSEAEKRRARSALAKGSGQKLGGGPSRSGPDMRNVIADVVTRRNNITEGCASGTSQADQVSRDADRNGFSTKAEEDDANDRAIAQALWELIQEEEARNAGLEPPDRTNHPSNPLEDQSPAKTQAAPSKPQTIKNSTRTASSVKPKAKHTPYQRRPPSRLLSEDEERRRKEKRITSTTPSITPSQSDPKPTAWTCEICTLVNPIDYLACDACQSERPSWMSALPTAIPVTSNPLERISSLGWNCRNCATFMEHQFWTCSWCGLMKSSSSIST